MCLSICVCVCVCVCVHTTCDQSVNPSVNLSWSKQALSICCKFVLKPTSAVWERNHVSPYVNYLIVGIAQGCVYHLSIVIQLSQSSKKDYLPVCRCFVRQTIFLIPGTNCHGNWISASTSDLTPQIDTEPSPELPRTISLLAYAKLWEARTSPTIHCILHVSLCNAIYWVLGGVACSCRFSRHLWYVLKITKSLCS